MIPSFDHSFHEVMLAGIIQMLFSLFQFDMNIIQVTLHFCYHSDTLWTSLCLQR